MSRKLKHIRRQRNGWQTYLRINGQFLSKCWPLETPLADMRAWIEDQLVKHSDDVVEVREGSFAADVDIYLARVAAMPTIAQRREHLARWVKELGGSRRRQTITTAEIDVVLQSWLETDAPGTVRKRRTALRSFFAKLDPHKLNPVKGSTNPPEPKPETRGLNYALIEQALAAMPDYRDTKPGAPRQMNLAKVRARVIAYTGIPPGLLKQILPVDLNFVNGTVRVGGRQKGQGVEARTIPLTDTGLEAFKVFHAVNAYGTFATTALNCSIKRGFKRAGLDPRRVRLYDLRHSFLSQLYRVTRDLATVARLGLHAEGSIVTARYARAAHDEVDQAAVSAFDAALSTMRQQTFKIAPTGAKRVQKPRKKLRAKVAQFRKSS